MTKHTSTDTNNRHKRRNTKKRSGFHFWHNLRFASILILLPLLVGGLTLRFLFGEATAATLGNSANKRIETIGTQDAADQLRAQKPTGAANTPQYSYYQLQTGQSLEWAAKHFGVSLATLQAMNPGVAVPGTSLKIPPVEQPFVPLSSTSAPTSYSTLVIGVEKGILTVSNQFTNPEVNLNFAQLASVLKAQGAIQEIGPKHYRLLKALSIEDNIRLDMTASTITKLDMKSDAKGDFTTLTFRNSEVLIQGVSVASLDTTTGKLDKDINDGRAFVRALKSARMDIIGSTLSDLGTERAQLATKDPAIAALVAGGGIYGVSWRIPTDSFGKEMVTGWVDKSTFQYNNIGAYTFGANGMRWQNSVFTYNDIYGLDPHDDSNNATIENNIFSHNGHHGFIVSKRCNNNIIRNNVSADNKLHGYMLHADSNYNVIENNIAIGNQDNYVIYGSNSNIIVNNKGYKARGSNVRINANSAGNYIIDNKFVGGGKAIYLYDKDRKSVV